MPRNRLAALAAAAIVLAGCGKDALAPATGDRLAADEAQALALSLAASGDAYTDAAPSASVVTLGPMSTGTTFGPITFKQSHPCPKGGSITPDITLQGSIDLAARSVSMELKGTETPKDCAFLVKANTITVNGDPDLAIAAHVAIANGVPSDPMTFSQEGGLSWSSSDGRSGTCSIKVSSTIDFAKNLRTVSGHFCDQTLDISGPLH